MQTSVTIYRDDSPIQVDVEIRQGMKAPRDEFGCPESPDDDDTVEILSAFDIDGKEVDLTAREDEQVFVAVEEECAGCFEDHRY